MRHLGLLFQLFGNCNNAKAFFFVYFISIFVIVSTIIDNSFSTHLNFVALKTLCNFTLLFNNDVFYCFPFICSSRYLVLAHLSSRIIIETYPVGWSLSFDQAFLWWLLWIFFIGLVFIMVVVMSNGLSWEIQHEWYKLILICICKKMFEHFEELPGCLCWFLKGKADRKTSALSKY